MRTLSAEFLKLIQQGNALICKRHAVRRAFCLCALRRDRPYAVYQIDFILARACRLRRSNDGVQLPKQTESGEFAYRRCDYGLDQIGEI